MQRSLLKITYVFVYMYVDYVYTALCIAMCTLCIFIVAKPSTEQPIAVDTSVPTTHGSGMC